MIAESIIFYPRIMRPCLPLPAVQAATTKILPTKCLNIAEPRIYLKCLFTNQIQLKWIETFNRTTRVLVCPRNSYTS